MARTIFWYIKENKIEKVKELLDSGVDVNTVNTYIRTPLSWAYDNHRYDILKMLVERGANLNFACPGLEHPLFWPIVNGDTWLVKYYIEQGADVHYTRATDDTWLHSATNKGHIEIIKELLKHDGFDLYAKNCCGDSPMSVATKCSTDPYYNRSVYLKILTIFKEYEKRKHLV